LIEPNKRVPCDRTEKKDGLGACLVLRWKIILLSPQYPKCFVKKTTSTMLLATSKTTNRRSINLRLLWLWSMVIANFNCTILLIIFTKNISEATTTITLFFGVTKIHVLLVERELQLLRLRSFNNIASRFWKHVSGLTCTGYSAKKKSSGTSGTCRRDKTLF